MTYDFDARIERKGSGCIKYDSAAAHGVSEDCIPLWVADMDFQAAPAISEAVRQVAEHGVYGYTDATPAYFEAVAGWYQRNFSWTVEKDWLVKTPGVVFALAMGVRAFTKPGEAVMITTPVYYPFHSVVVKNHRRLVDSPLTLKDGHYEMDFADIEDKIVKEQVKLFILCSPHNPVGRVWKKEELFKLEEICLCHGVLLISDEIHSDFVWEGVHTPMLLAHERARENVVVCTAPRKSFNLAGLCCSNIFLPNPELRSAFQQEIAAAGAGMINQAGLAATRAAYEQGQEWLDQVRSYIRSNYAYMSAYIQENIPSLKVMECEGTYLAWVDFRRLGLTEEERQDLLLNKAKLWLDSGIMFGKVGEGFERINLATRREVICQAMKQLKEAIGE